MTVTEVSREMTVLIDTIKSGGHIGHFARALNITIADASVFIGEAWDKIPKLAEYFEIKHWPRNVNTGYIYNGTHAIKSPVGERKGMLKPGEHVLGERLPKRDKSQSVQYYAIYMSVPVIETRFEKFKCSRERDFTAPYSASKWELNEVKNNKFPSKVLIEPVLDDKKNIKSVWFLESGFNLDELIEDMRAVGIRLKRTNDTRRIFKKDMWFGEIDGRFLTPVKYDGL